MATTRLMPLHIGKGRDISTAIADIIDYVENPQKTDLGKFIYGYECDTRLADADGRRSHHLHPDFCRSDLHTVVWTEETLHQQAGYHTHSHK